MTVLGGGAFSYERGTPVVTHSVADLVPATSFALSLYMGPQPSHEGYRGTSLIRNCLLLGPYSGTMLRALRWSYGGGSFL